MLHRPRHGGREHLYTNTSGEPCADAGTLPAGPVICLAVGLVQLQLWSGARRVLRFPHGRCPWPLCWCFRYCWVQSLTCGCCFGLACIPYCLALYWLFLRCATRPSVHRDLRALCCARRPPWVAACPYGSPAAGAWFLREGLPTCRLALSATLRADLCHFGVGARLTYLHLGTPPVSVSFGSASGRLGEDRDGAWMNSCALAQRRPLLRPPVTGDDNLVRDTWWRRPCRAAEQRVKMPSLQHVICRCGSRRGNCPGDWGLVGGHTVHTWVLGFLPLWCNSRNEGVRELSWSSWGPGAPHGDELPGGRGGACCPLVADRRVGLGR